MTTEKNPLVGSIEAGNICDNTINGWLWYCDTCDTHGNADSEKEARHYGDAHLEWITLMVDEERAQECFVHVWLKTKVS